jgi:hypothetical protein
MADIDPSPLLRGAEGSQTATSKHKAPPVMVMVVIAFVLGMGAMVARSNHKSNSAGTYKLAGVDHPGRTGFSKQEVGQDSKDGEVTSAPGVTVGTPLTT